MSGKKPEKPYEGYPLFAHASGQWAKKINGKTFYFGVWADPAEAIAKYQRERDSLESGVATAKDKDVSVKYLCESFLNSKDLLVQSGELTPRTFYEYQSVAQLICDTFGKQASVSGLTPADFEKLRAGLAKRLGPVTLTNMITRIKVVFHYAEGAHLIPGRVRFGAGFKGATKKARRMARSLKPKRLFSPDNLRASIDAASPHMRAIILLGINCGFGNTDISELPRKAVDLGAGWIRYPRPKTGVLRECPLWPVTVDALRRSEAKRPKSSPKELSHLFFVTQRKQPYVHFNSETGSICDAVTLNFGKLLSRLGIKSPGQSFYGLRHTFQTIGEGAGDPVAVRWIMGHASSTGEEEMDDAYREEIAASRLQAVVNHVGAWLEVSRLRQL